MQDDSNPVLLKKVMDITDVVVACRETGLDWFEQLLNTVSQDSAGSLSTVLLPGQMGRSHVVAVRC